jgi:hypothetical protein
MDRTDVLGLIIALFICCCFFGLGVKKGVDFKNSEAVAAGVAHYTVDKEGNVKFEYNK